MNIQILAIQWSNNKIVALKTTAHSSITFKNLLLEISFKGKVFFINVDGNKHYFKISKDNKRIIAPRNELLKELPTF